MENGTTDFYHPCCHSKNRNGKTLILASSHSRRDFFLHQNWEMFFGGSKSRARIYIYNFYIYIHILYIYILFIYIHIYIYVHIRYIIYIYMSCHWKWCCFPSGDKDRDSPHLREEYLRCVTNGGVLKFS